MRTTPLDSRLLAMVLVIAFAVFPPAALGGYRDDMHVTSIEMAMLPQFWHAGPSGSRTSRTSTRLS